MAQRRLTRADQIHRGKTPIRRHFLPERAEQRGLSQADLSRELEVEKSTVSRWFAGTIPDNHNLDKLVSILQLEDTSDLFRHPDDDWMARFLQGRDRDEKERIKATLEAAFPKRTGTRG
jgi:transcriptional regulator with XRE-family HTH domain